jgi:hypothetical protein
VFRRAGTPRLALGPNRCGRIWHEPAPNWHVLTGALAEVAFAIRVVWGRSEPVSGA